MSKALTASQIRNLVILYLYPCKEAVNGNTWGSLVAKGLAESGWTKDPRTHFHRCTAAGRKIAETELERLNLRPIVGGGQ